MCTSPSMKAAAPCSVNEIGGEGKRDKKKKERD
jgi:hypothetical protein